MEQELQWTQAFAMIRLGAISQGIAARVAQRQASSAVAKKHAVARWPITEFAWILVKEFEENGDMGRRTKARI